MESNIFRQVYGPSAVSSHFGEEDSQTDNGPSRNDSQAMESANHTDSQTPANQAEVTEEAEPTNHNETTDRTPFVNIGVNSPNQLFETLFLRTAISYVRIFPQNARRLIECLSLLFAFASLIVFMHVHYSFVRSPVTCFDHLVTHNNESVPLRKHRILRIELLKNPPKDYNLSQSYEKEFLLRSYDPAVGGSHWSDVLHSTEKERNSDKGGADNAPDTSPKEISSSTENLRKISDDPLTNLMNKLSKGASYMRQNWGVHILFRPFQDVMSDFEIFVKSVGEEDRYIVEYSLEYGFLRLAPETRKELNITVDLVTLDIDNSTCFGNSLTRLLLHEFLGYNDLLMACVRRLAGSQNNRGFVRNVVTGDHFRFTSNFSTRVSYFYAFIIMILFTMTVTTILRFSHQQIYGFIMDLLHMLENNVQTSFPAAPLTVILALVGVEAIMSEFFSDTTTAFYTIAIVWVADQYDSVCCRTFVSRKYWYRFFYLYHYCFYAYHNRFHGQYGYLALLTSWLFILHSMIYFFHHYELPILVRMFVIDQNRVVIDSVTPQTSRVTSRRNERTELLVSE